MQRKLHQLWLKNRLAKPQLHLISQSLTRFRRMASYRQWKFRDSQLLQNINMLATPKLSAKAYLAADITDWAKLSLQTGEATLYFENSFVGKSTIKRKSAV